MPHHPHDVCAYEFSDSVALSTRTVINGTSLTRLSGTPGFMERKLDSVLRPLSEASVVSRALGLFETIVHTPNSWCVLCFFEEL